jgi:lipopolysaccharide biosynthesis regulator YciM
MTNLRLLFSLLLSGYLSLTTLSLDAQELEVARRYAEMSQFSHAKSILLPLSQKASDPIVFFTLGKIYQIENSLDSANIYFEKIVTGYSGSPLSLLGQTIIDFNNKKETENSNFSKAEKSATSSKDLYALTQIAIARYITGDTVNWEKSLEMANNIDRKYVKAYIIAGDILTAIAESAGISEDYGKISGRYEQALYYAPTNVEAKTKLSNIYLIARNFSGAELALTEVLTIDSSYIPALKAMGELEYMIGKYSQASYYFGKYMAVAEYTQKDISKYINILYFNKEYAKSHDLISQNLVNDPDNPVLLRLKGYTSYELKKYKVGLEAMTKFFLLRSNISSDKIIFTDYEYYGKLLSRNGEDSLAVQSLNKALAMDSTKVYLYEDVAKSYEKLKKYNQAISSYDKLIANSKNVSPGIYFNKGLALNFLASDTMISQDSLKVKNYILEADTAFGNVCNLSPNSHLGFLYRARMQSKLDPESVAGLAKPYYENALTIIESKNDSIKYKNEILEIYRYLGYYYYLQYQSENESKNTLMAASHKKSSIQYWQMILAFEPKDKIALQALKAFD